MCKISVIIPFYNSEKYIKICIESIINQSLKDIEIICINDGSTDNSLEIIEQLSLTDSRIKIYSQENKGVSAARNLGLSLSKGKYIYFIDSDDYIKQDTLEKSYNLAEETNSDIIIFDVNNVYGETIISTNRVHDFVKKNKKQLIEFSSMPEIVYQNCYTVCKLYNKDFIYKNKLEFPVGIVNSEDTIFWFLSLFCNPKISLLDESLYFYRKHENNFNSSDSAHIIKTLFDSYIYFSNTDDFKKTSILNQILVLDYYLRISVFLWSSSNDLKSLKTYEKGLKLFKKEFNKYKIQTKMKLQGILLYKYRYFYLIGKFLYLKYNLFKNYKEKK